MKFGDILFQPNQIAAKMCFILDKFIEFVKIILSFMQHEWLQADPQVGFIALNGYCQIAREAGRDPNSSFRFVFCA